MKRHEAVPTGGRRARTSVTRMPQASAADGVAFVNDAQSGHVRWSGGALVRETMRSRRAAAGVA